MDQISKIRERIGAAQFQGETAVREAIVLPVLQSMGWDIFDPNAVVRELTLGSRRVDYALCATPPRRDVFIEVKAIGLASGADRQLFEYSYHEGIPFAVLTDGREWSFFLPGEQGSYDERRVQKLDLIERSHEDVIRTFRRYLEHDRVRSGAALESARSDYQDISKRKLASQTISIAWSHLVRDADELLIDLIAEKVEAVCGYRPATEDVEAFLASDLVVETPTPVEVARPRRPGIAHEPVSERRIEFKMLGENRRASNAIEALVDILRALAKRDSAFLEQVAPLVQGRTRNHLARARNDVYPHRPELSEYTLELVPGWWLGTNISNRDKMKLIRKACEVSRLQLGSDIVIALPNG